MIRDNMYMLLGFVGIVLISIAITFLWMPGYDSFFIDTPTNAQTVILLQGDESLRIKDVKLSPTSNPCVTKFSCDIKFMLPWVSGYMDETAQLDFYLSKAGIRRITDAK